MTPNPEMISGAVGRLYDAAYGAATWSEALAGLTTLFDGSRGWLFHTRSNAVVGHTSLDDPEFHSDEARQAIMRDPFFLACRTLPPGEVVLHSQMHDVETMRRRELWQDWLRPRDLYFGMQCLVKVNADDHYLIDISRDARRGDFTDEHRSIMRRIVPHLARAGDIGAMLAGSGRRAPGSGSAAMLVVDRNLQVIEADGAARRLLDRHSHVVAIAGTRLSLGCEVAARRLHDLVSACIAADDLEPGPATRFLMIGGSHGAETSQLLAAVAPHTPSRPFGFGGERHAAVFLRPLHEGDAEALDQALISLFELNPSHARLARTLATGMSLRQAAAERGISYASARTYLEHVFHKTGTSRQPQLVALVKTIETALPL
jgi:DNA-binding CsgD family transcriptional regulator